MIFFPYFAHSTRTHRQEIRLVDIGTFTHFLQKCYFPLQKKELVSHQNHAVAFRRATRLRFRRLGLAAPDFAFLRQFLDFNLAGSFAFVYLPLRWTLYHPLGPRF